mmetsp:Transcript_16487/g.49874  ORF Transcript_16487/g.49874 Transcript_16487/m.49874 type:complete len:251 (-) Transcript_16487:131-883(-)
MATRLRKLAVEARATRWGASFCWKRASRERRLRCRTLTRTSLTFQRILSSTMSRARARWARLALRSSSRRRRSSKVSRMRTSTSSWSTWHASNSSCSVRSWQSQSKTVAFWSRFSSEAMATLALRLSHSFSSASPQPCSTSSSSSASSSRSTTGIRSSASTTNSEIFSSRCLARRLVRRTSLASLRTSSRSCVISSRTPKSRNSSRPALSTAQASACASNFRRNRYRSHARKITRAARMRAPVALRNSGR